MKPYVCCHYCGSNYLNKGFASPPGLEHGSWPKTCASCLQIAYRNPLPVVVVVIPLMKEPYSFRGPPSTYEAWVASGGLPTTGVLAVRRNIPPDKGKLALVSGYIDDQEHWKDAAIRELKEETTLSFRREQLELMDVDSSKNMKHILVFCKTPRMMRDQIPKMEPNEEVQELVAVDNPTQLVWEAHQRMARRVWD